MADYINDEYVRNSRNAQRPSGDTIQTERRHCKLIYFGFGLLCILQAILNISLRLTEPGGCVSPYKCPTGWILIRNRCYFISTQSKPWTDSRADCLSKGADLVVINSRHEQIDLYYPETLNNALWIGLFYEETSGIFKWVDGTALNTSFWQHGQPDRGRSINVENCVEIYKPFHVLANWNDLNCDTRRSWICEKDAGSTMPK